MEPAEPGRSASLVTREEGLAGCLLYAVYGRVRATHRMRSALASLEASILARRRPRTRFASPRPSGRAATSARTRGKREAPAPSRRT